MSVVPAGLVVVLFVWLVVSLSGWLAVVGSVQDKSGPSDTDPRILLSCVIRVGHIYLFILV
jgi:hypothetical protein